MFHFISHSDETVHFTKEEAWEIPYARDAFDDFAGGHDDENTLEFPYASTFQLILLREAIRAKLKAGSYCPQKETFVFGDSSIPLPPFVGLLWGKPFETFLYSLNQEEIAKLITIADTTCMWKLRDNVIRMMFIRIIFNDAKLTDFFPSPTDTQIDMLRNIYQQELTSVSHNDCCGLLNNNGSD